MNPVNQVAGQARPKAKVLQLRKPNQNSYLPVRKAITRSKKTVRVKYASHKAQMVIDCESALEALAAKHLDLSPAVRDLRPQPTKIDLVVNDKPTVYTPDFKVWLSSGQITYVEVKPLSKCFSEDIRDKLIAAHHYFEERRFGFRVVTEQDLCNICSIENLRTLRYYVRVPVSHAVRLAVRTYVDSRILSTIGELISQGFSKPTLYSLIANRAIDADLKTEFSANTPIFLPEENDHEKCLYQSRSAIEFA